MKRFQHVNAGSFEEAGRLLREAGGRAEAMAGGSDLMGVYKDSLLEEYPETVVNLKHIPGFSHIEAADGKIAIGAGTKLSEIAEDETVKNTAPALAEAAYSVASPLIRNMGTIGGNVCQGVRCWYYRYPDSVGGRLNCKRKGGDTCYAINGENRYHSVFGGAHLHGSSCVQSCPAGTDIPTYMDFLRKNDWENAAWTIMKYNPMPMITSRICPHPCQDNCNQCVYGDAVNIHGVERSVADYILEHADIFYAAPVRETGKKAVVIGAGPGGLAAAYYLRQAGNTVEVYDRMAEAGGVLRYGIPHYRLSREVLDAFISALEQMGIVFRMGTEIGKDITVEQLKEESDTLYFGTGAWKQPVLGLEGENLTEFGLDFLTEVNTYLKKAIGEEVLVCGGGNVAMDVALTASRLGAKKVRMVCLEQRDEMPASEDEIEMAIEEGVEICNGWGLGGVIQDAGGRIRGLRAKRCTSVRDASGRFNPVYDEEDVQVIESDYIILATGQRVDLEFLGEELAAQLKNTRGLIQTDKETQQTEVEGMYAGGDAVTGPNIAIRAIAAGRAAAVSMNRKMGAAADGSGGSVQRAYSGCSICKTSPDGSLCGQLHSFDPDGIGEESAGRLPQKPARERNLTGEDRGSFDAAASAREAARCMNCGCYAVNASDLTPVLLMLDAEVITTERTLTAAQLFTAQIDAQQVLHTGELVKEIIVPKRDGIMHYDKKRVRNAIDFAIVSLASCFEVQDGVILNARIVFGGVAPVPYEMTGLQDFLRGKKITGELAREAAELAVRDCVAMSKNTYKIFMMKDLIAAAVIRAKEESAA